MPVIPFPEWKPDLTDYMGSASQVITNVVPQGDGYGPFPSFAAMSAALTGPVRGYFFAKKADGSILIFAATSTDLYTMSNITFTWTKVSIGGGPYSALSTGFNWQFVQFNNLVFATQQNAVLQYWDLTSSSAFANALGSPPQASYISIVNRFLVLSGLSSFPYRIQWSGLNNVNASTSWDNVTAQSNFQDLADGGLTRGVSGGDQFGVVFQDSIIRSMTFNPGSPEVFDFFKISESEGIFAPQSVVKAGGSTFYISNAGFRTIPPGGIPTPIGKEKFDRFFFRDCDSANLQYCMGAADPRSPRIYWAYKSVAGSASLFDKIIIYDWQLQRATIVSVSGEYMTTLSKPGLTLESMDLLAGGIITITGAADNGSGLIRLTLSSEIANWTYGAADTTHSPGQAGTTNLGDGSQNTVEVYGVTGTTEANGNWQYTKHDSTHIDLIGSAFSNAYVSGGSIGGALDSLALSLDSYSTSPLSALSMANANNVVGFFAGPNTEAILETAEQELDARYRMRVQGIAPITDCATATVSVTMRETLQAAQVLSAEQAVNAIGNCPFNVSSRLVRGKLRNPAGSVWTFAAGLRPKMVREGIQ